MNRVVVLDPEELRTGVIYPEYPPDAILSLNQMAAALHLDRKTVVRLASMLGGRRFGRRWRFRWGSAMEVFNANANQGQGECLAGQSDNQWAGGGQQDFSSWAQERPRVDAGAPVGDRKKKGNSRSSKSQDGDAYGLRAALGLG